MDCEKARMLINEYIDGQLDEESASALFSHIDTCPGCAMDLKRSERMKEWLLNLPEAETPPALLSSAVKRAKQELQQEKRPALTKRVVAVAAAVVVTLGIGVYLFTNPLPGPQAAPLARNESKMQNAEAAPEAMDAATPESPAAGLFAGAPETPATAESAAAPLVPAASAAPSSAPASKEPEKTGKATTGDRQEDGQDTTQIATEELTPVTFTIPEASREAFTKDIGLLIENYSLTAIDPKTEEVEDGICFLLTKEAAGDLKTILVKYNIDIGQDAWPSYPLKIIFEFSKE